MSKKQLCKFSFPEDDCTLFVVDDGKGNKSIRVDDEAMGIGYRFGFPRPPEPATLEIVDLENLEMEESNDR
jgi:hypothetical protein